MEIYKIDFNNCSTEELRRLTAKPLPEYVFLGKNDIEIPDESIQKIITALRAEPEPSMVYSDYTDGNNETHELIDCHEGSVRDGFDFGAAVAVNSKTLKKAIAEIGEYNHAAFYAARLALSRFGGITHIAEPLYSGKRIKRRHIAILLSAYDQQLAQRELEDAFTQHLKSTGAYISPENIIRGSEFDDTLPVEASGHHSRTQPSEHDRRRCKKRAESID